MAIRLRRVGGILVALCAARSVPREGDVYLDDGQHHALVEKFWRDYPQLGISVPPEVRERVAKEESCNPAREQWERIYGPNSAEGPQRPGFGYIEAIGKEREPQEMLAAWLLRGGLHAYVDLFTCREEFDAAVKELAVTLRQGHHA